MQRDSADNKLSFSADDLVLFRKSPFASWMERLTLENPRHGIPPDADAPDPVIPARPQNAFAATLRANSRRFVQIEWEASPRQRATATLDAMRRGVDFIVDGQLAVGPLNDSVNLLMRTSGFSELGDYLYLPCDTAGQYGAEAAFRLCFLADLLHSLQGQLPPQLIEIRRGEELNALETERHIHFYRAVKQRFMLAQRNFRKHRMPNPAESAECGRWYACANEVLRQRLHLRQQREEEAPASSAPVPEAVPAQAVEQVAVAVNQSPDMDRDRAAAGIAAELAGTLAEQARRLDVSPPAVARHDDDAPPARLQPLSFIAAEIPDAFTDGQPDEPPENQPDAQPGQPEVPKVALVDADLEAPEVLRRPAPGPTLDTSEPETGRDTPPRPARSHLVDPDIPTPHPLDTPGFNVTAYRRQPVGGEEPVED
ncbi:hypothetical protein FV139_12705 [Parahaliea maris]|uniref:Uncharacterized protein n=1 Tax=Parahaliea maris TaxID=2716870 RepID=A0A5C8ZYL5_9GAMM|nr:hypothetical protein [Parahaliea maris]TXS92824.1 hypothetical protein FV139_12705 [Parahaliea maris]